MIARPHLQKLVERARLLPPLPAAMVFPVDRDSLQLALSGAFAGYLAPTLVGPESRIRDAANRAGLDISRLSIVDTPDEPRAASQRAVLLAREGKVSGIVRGSLAHEHLLAPIAEPSTGLRGERRLSHAMFLDLPGQSRFLLLADACLNVAPTLAAKKDILVNTLELAQALGVTAPHVALLAAKTIVAPAFPSTSEASALRSMAAQGEFPAAIVDGPLTIDVALNADAARLHGMKSDVAGRADCLIAPTMEAAAMVLHTLTAITGGLAAGVVLGASVPIIAPSPRDPIEVRIASCVLASLLVAAKAPAHQAAPVNAEPARVAGLAA
ncbi:MAG TPA: bifunctional enoyl-CoA hydratase/phosphate acetyltransferase [Casimicrobiaceae bacterium]|nr:bifunctional enoyl-CoA hydratase/phosphate acetyltransferase [Casimicrobiaceae bacterium]